LNAPSGLLRARLLARPYVITSQIYHTSYCNWCKPGRKHGKADNTDIKETQVKLYRGCHKSDEKLSLITEGGWLEDFHALVVCW